MSIMRMAGGRVGFPDRCSSMVRRGNGMECLSTLCRPVFPESRRELNQMEERMKKVFLVLSLLVFFCCGVFFVGAGLAQEKATKEECVAKVKEAVAMVKEIGLDA